MSGRLTVAGFLMPALVVGGGIGGFLWFKMPNMRCLSLHVACVTDEPDEQYVGALKLHAGTRCWVALRIANTDVLDCRRVYVVINLSGGFTALDGTEEAKDHSLTQLARGDTGLVRVLVRPPNEAGVTRGSFRIRVTSEGRGGTYWTRMQWYLETGFPGEETTD